MGDLFIWLCNSFTLITFGQCWLLQISLESLLKLRLCSYLLIFEGFFNLLCILKEAFGLLAPYLLQALDWLHSVLKCSDILDKSCEFMYSCWIFSMISNIFYSSSLVIIFSFGSSTGLLLFSRLPTFNKSCDSSGEEILLVGSIILILYFGVFECDFGDLSNFSKF